MVKGEPDMGETIRLRASDGFSVSAYRGTPAGTAIGGLVVVQEIFGVNGHIRNVVDRFAADGFLAIAPALFDRIAPGIEIGYSPADIEKGMEIRAKTTSEDALRDIEAAREALATAGRVGVIGYCWGGFLAWLSATRLPGFSAAVVYYGGGIGAVAAEAPRCPVLAHFGDKDQHIPLADVDKLKAHANVEVHVYPADHGFNCDERGSYDKPSADKAQARTLAFLRRELGAR